MEGSLWKIQFPKDMAWLVLKMLLLLLRLLVVLWLWLQYFLYRGAIALLEEQEGTHLTRTAA
jgi:hypothetical protein